MATFSVSSSKSHVQLMVQKFEMQGGSSPNGDRQTQHGKQKPKFKVDLVFWRPPPRRKWKLRSSAGKGESSDALSRAFKHWAVLCCLDNGASYVVDAVQENGVLNGRLKTNDAKCKPLEKLSLGVYPLDYGDITKAFGEIAKPGKYSVMKNNCQEWVIDLLRTMKISVPPEVRTIADLISRLRLLSGSKVL
ncbi:uncharacterized protein LOC119180105 isoform X2 [Rhipicephalus microplus]|uniref:uncharacterized protein LOC119180105 isoform X2 n=1 Tax=Rhipicephalus microplus TaxID=6941 RepID=UPI003F6D401F